MQLKRIQLVGFKSFVDATTIPVISHLNAIVGPNGCGKSNIVDAIRWVSGEMSAKQLRGQSMSDVIFNGTTSRKPVGKASVELVFDNSDGRIAGEYAGFSEISIRREVVRDGQSAYFINGVPARRRDLVDLFLGTGLGPRSYAIIEQGMISQLIEAKPEDMRTHLEEVAGISKYRERRRETETRIHHTQENLSRLNDVREELTKQLQHLQRQSRAAEQYKVLQQDQRLLHAQVKALQWQTFEDQLQEYRSRLSEQMTESEAQMSMQRELETKIEKSRLTTQNILDEKNGVQKNFYELGAHIARLEQQIQNKQEALAQWKKELQTSTELWSELTTQSQSHTETTKTLAISIQKLKPLLGEHQAEFQAANQVLSVAEKKWRDAQTTWDQFQAQLSKSNEQYEIAKNNIQHYETQKKQLSEREQRLQAQIAGSSAANLSKDIEPLAKEVSALKQTVAATEALLNRLSSAIQTERQTYQAAQTALTQLQGEWQKSEAQHASLSLLQQHQQESQTWLKLQGLDKKERLGKIIRVASGWELAIETILGGALAAICVDTFSTYHNKLSSLSQGKITLLQKSAAEKSRLSQQTVRDVITPNDYLPAWTSNIYLADNMKEALSLQSNLRDNESVITKEGYWIGRNWLHVNASYNDGNSFLLREKNITELTETIATQTAQLSVLKQKTAAAKEALETLESQRESAHGAFQKQSAEQTNAQATLHEKQSRLNALTEQQQRVQSELQQITTQLSSCESALKAAMTIVTERQQMQSADHANRDRLLSEKSSAEQTVSSARMNAQIKKQKADDVQLQLSFEENQLVVLNESLRTSHKQLIQLTERRDVLQTQIVQSDDPLLQWNTQLQSLLQQRMVIEKELQKIEGRLQEEQTALQAHEAACSDVETIHAQLQEKRQQLQLAQQELLVRQTTLKEQIAELQFEFSQLLSGLPEGAALAEWEEKSQAIQRKIDRLGPINLAAIDEFNTLTERKVYMDQQCTDLEEALNILQEAIRKIDRETRHLFKDTFDQLNTRFQKLFPQIFGGGQAGLVLTEDDLLTAGVIVKAQPPGKRNTTIHLLSGGEKTLTAISLMFAMFQLNPAPFCVLDEVDAPLDDLNVGRFCHLVKEMAKDTQFLVISHNKITIETADYLMGVTMQEPGVSRIVSVDMEKAVELVEA